jgi:LuxR family maltose regulon positive regulatory protein
MATLSLSGDRADPLLATKLFVPPARPQWVARPRLIERIRAGIASHHKLTLLSAPAGFGKTTLLGEWAHTCGLPCAWLSLDQDDNDLARFLAYLLAALQAALQTIEGHAGDVSGRARVILQSRSALSASPAGSEWAHSF